MLLVQIRGVLVFKNIMKKFISKEIKKIVLIHLLVICFFILPLFVSAQKVQTTPSGPTGTPVAFTIPNPIAKSGANDLMGLITALLNNVVMPVAAVGVVIWIVYAGFTFITAQGKEAEITKAKDRLLWALVGAGILLGAVGISKVVENTVKALL